MSSGQSKPAAPAAPAKAAEVAAPKNKHLPLWIGLGVLVFLIVGAVLIFFFGGGKNSGFRLDELDNKDVQWFLEGGSVGGQAKAAVQHTGPLRDLFFDIRMDKGGGGSGDKRDVEVVFASCRIGWRTNDIMRIIAKDSNGTDLTARVVEWDAEKKNKLAEVIVVKGKLEGPAYVWDSAGRLINQMNFVKDQPMGKSTAIERDADGKELVRRLLWWDKDRFTTEQVYLMSSNRIQWMADYDNSKLKVLRRWVNQTYTPYTDPTSGEVKKEDKKIVYELVPGRTFKKLPMSSSDIFGIPKEAGGFVDADGQKKNNPTYTDMLESTKDTPWEKELAPYFTGFDMGKSRFDKEEQPGGRK
ncbi:MAG: hypothetical protein EXS28_06675 [Pedosphaera sp.]|nr:hypothetical protein [Pedosphaera sp.]